MMNYLDHNIKLLRKTRQETQLEFALQFGVKRSRVGAWEEGRAIPSVYILRRLSRLAKVDMEEFIFTKFHSLGGPVTWTEYEYKQERI